MSNISGPKFAADRTVTIILFVSAIALVILMGVGATSWLRSNYFGNDQEIAVEVVGKVTQSSHYHYYGKRRIDVPELYYVVLAQKQDSTMNSRVNYWHPVAGEYDFYYNAIPVDYNFWSHAQVGKKLKCRCFKGLSGKDYQAKLIWTP